MEGGKRARFRVKLEAVNVYYCTGQLRQLEVAARNFVENHNFALLIQQVLRLLALYFVQPQSLFYWNLLEALLQHLHVAQRTPARTQFHGGADRRVVVLQKISTIILPAHVRFAEFFDIPGIAVICADAIVKNSVRGICAFRCARAVRIRVFIA